MKRALVVITGFVLLAGGCGGVAGTTVSNGTPQPGATATSDPHSTSSTVAARDFASLDRSDQRLLRNLQLRLYWVIDESNSLDEQAVQRIVGGEWSDADERQARRILFLLDLSLAESERAAPDFAGLEIAYQQWVAHLRARHSAMAAIVDAMQSQKKPEVAMALQASLDTFSELEVVIDGLKPYAIPKINEALVTSDLSDAETQYLRQVVAALAAVEADMGAGQGIAEGREPWSTINVSAAVKDIGDFKATWSSYDSPSPRFDYLHDRVVGALSYGKQAADVLDDSASLSKTDLVDQARVLFRLAGLDSQLAFMLYTQIDSSQE